MNKLLGDVKHNIHFTRKSMTVIGGRSLIQFMQFFYINFLDSRHVTLINEPYSTICHYEFYFLKLYVLTLKLPRLTKTGFPLTMLIQ